MNRTDHSESIEVETTHVDGPIEADEIVVSRPVSDSRMIRTYIALPIVFLAVTLLGGFRLGASDNSFIFLRPALICLVFAAALSVILARSGVVRIAGWFDEDHSILHNAANGAVLLTLFTASVQMFNSLLPEKGLPFWVVGFCFAWSLVSNAFADFDAVRSIRSLGVLFAFAFVAKYLILANLTAPESSSWLQRIYENPAKEAFTWLLDLPRYSAGTGYIQFFNAALFLTGLYLTPPKLEK